MTCKRPDDGKYKRCYKSCENNADCSGNCGHCTPAASCLAAISLLDPPLSCPSFIGCITGHKGKGDEYHRCKPHSETNED